MLLVSDQVAMGVERLDVGLNGEGHIFLLEDRCVSFGTASLRLSPTGNRLSHYRHLAYAADMQIVTEHLAPRLQPAYARTSIEVRLVVVGLVRRASSRRILAAGAGRPSRRASRSRSGQAGGVLPGCGRSGRSSARPLGSLAPRGTLSRADAALDGTLHGGAGFAVEQVLPQHDRGDPGEHLGGDAGDDAAQAARRGAASRSYSCRRPRRRSRAARPRP